jgi:hypothetical protein
VLAHFDTLGKDSDVAVELSIELELQTGSGKFDGSNHG